MTRLFGISCLKEGPLPRVEPARLDVVLLGITSGGHVPDPVGVEADAESALDTPCKNGKIRL
jgi:hypothetical protein